MKKTVVLLFFLVCARTLLAASFDPSLNWRTITTGHFDIHYGSSLEREARIAAKYLEEAHAKLSPKFSWKPFLKTQVILTDNNDTANGLASTLPYNWILLRIASPGPDSVLADYDNWLRTLIFHEYTHVLHIDQYGGFMKLPRFLLGKVVAPNGTVPGWMREGIATYEETVETAAGRGRGSYSEMMLRTAVLGDKFLKIDQADGTGWRWPGYQSMYMYGVKFLQYLSEKYGEDKLMEFHKRMGRSPLLYAVNHQARHVFNDIRFESKKMHNRYARVRKEGTPRSKTFYDLWREWEEYLKEKYARVKEEVEAEGLTEFETVVSKEAVLLNPALSKDGKFLAYARMGPKRPPELHLLSLEYGYDRVIKKRHAVTHIAFSPDGKSLVYSASGGYKTYNNYSDIHLYDMETGRFKRLTKGERAYDPSFSPDGKRMVVVRQTAGTGHLAIYDIEKGEMTRLTKEEGEFVQFSAPAWSPDGRTIAVSSWQLGRPLKRGEDIPLYPAGAWDIYLYDALTGKKIGRLTNDTAVDSNPVWDGNGRDIYFVSDKSGISNVYKINRITNHESRVTNVLTGVFQPSLSPDGKALYVQYYNGDGFDIRMTALASGRAGVPALKRDGGGDAGMPARFSLIPPARTLTVRGAENGEELQGKKYSPFGKSLLLPRFVVPNLATIDDGVILAAYTGGADPLRRHSWMGGVTYRTDLTNFIGYFFNYWYNRYKPVFSTGIFEYAVNFGNLTFLHSDGTTNTVHLYEGRRRLYGGVSYPWGRQAFGLQYFWENRRSVTNISTEERDALNLGNFAGFSASYSYGQSERYPASISSEHGRKLRMNFTVTDKALGSASKNEQRIFAGDYREYLNLPWANHILALRSAGGMVWGDKLVQGTFTLGGSLGEGLLGGGDSLYYFPLRGLPIASLSRNRAMLFSGEYRIPLVSPQRGMGTTPFFIKNVHIAPFTDYGNAWNAETDTGKYFFDNFFLGTGLEVRGDFVLGHGLPVSGRAGWGIIVVNRDRLGSAKDPVLKTPAKDGVLILELGTAF